MFRKLLQATTGPNLLETDVAQAVTARTDGTTQIVDVREPEEWASGHIPGAIHIPLGELMHRQQKLDPARPVITVCRSGNRSLTAARALKGAGFENVRSMSGGMVAWAKAGHPVKR
jgi:rhodanese-related sulfurtransferase